MEQNANVKVIIKIIENNAKTKLELNKTLHETDVIIFQKLINNFISKKKRKEKNSMNYIKRPQYFVFT